LGTEEIIADMQLCPADYLLVINFNKVLEEQVRAVRKEFTDTYGINSNESKPHLKVAAFKAYPSVEQRILQHLEASAAKAAPVRIQLENYGSLPTHTIYINITTQAELKRLVGDIKSRSKLMRIENHNPYFMDDPFVPVAQKIKAMVYEKAWPDYRQRSFSGSFVADGMTLLKIENTSFTVIKKYPFTNTAKEATQVSLF
jgi:hypothetical protein